MLSDSADGSTTNGHIAGGAFYHHLS